MNRVILKTAVAGLAIAGLFVAAGSASAHHSGAMFDRSTKLELEGTIKSFEWTNPHARIWVLADEIINVTNPDKKTVRKPSAPELWALETGSPGNLARGGWSRRTLNPGDKVTIDVSPLYSGGHAGMGGNIVLLNGKPWERPKGAGKGAKANAD